MARRRRAMTTEHAREVKVSGHRNEDDFASLIGGEVNLGSHTDKKDVIDRQHRSHSVKAGTWWQIFLYGRERLRTNTIFQGLGQVANIMVDCIDAYPADRDDYVSDPIAAKERLQPHMRRLLAELQQPNIFRAFLDKALFDGGNADYLSIFLGRANTDIEEKVFHIFHKDEVVNALAADVELRNSKARNRNQMDDQKVTFRSRLHNKVIGEIEDRHDSRGHYKQMKFRLNARSVFDILEHHIEGARQLDSQVIAYGRAARLFRLG